MEEKRNEKRDEKRDEKRKSNNRTVIIVLSVIVGLGILSNFFGEKEPQTNDDTPIKEETASVTTEATTPNTAEITAATTTEAITEAVTKTYTVGDTITLKHIKVTLLEAHEIESDNQFNLPTEGKVFIGAKFEIENISSVDRYLTTGSTTITAYCNDIALSDTLNAIVACPEGSAGSNVAPGKKIIGWSGFEAPEDWAEIEFSVEDEGWSTKKAEFVLTK